MSTDGWDPALTEDYTAGSVVPSGSTGDQSDTWADPTPPANKNPWPFTRGSGDGYDALSKDDPASAHMSPGYGGYSDGNSFPRGAGPDLPAQDLRGYVLNEPGGGPSTDVEGPNKGPLWKPRVHAVGSLAQTELAGDDSKAPAQGPSRTTRPDPLGQAAKRTPSRRSPADGAGPYGD